MTRHRTTGCSLLAPACTATAVWRRPASPAAAAAAASIVVGEGATAIHRCACASTTRAVRPSIHHLHVLVLRTNQPINESIHNQTIRVTYNRTQVKIRKQSVFQKTRDVSYIHVYSNNPFYKSVQRGLIPICRSTELMKRLTLYTPKAITVLHRIIRSWYTGR